jgi:hypothetical protein
VFVPSTPVHSKGSSVRYGDGPCTALHTNPHLGFLFDLKPTPTHTTQVTLGRVQSGTCLSISFILHLTVAHDFSFVKFPSSVHSWRQMSSIKHQTTWYSRHPSLS